MLTVHKDDRTLFKEQKEITAKDFLETPSENDTIFSATTKGFSDSYNIDDKKWGQVVADDVQNGVVLAFNETISEDHLNKLLERANLPNNCKSAQAKLISPVIFSIVFRAIRSTDIKLKDIQKDYSTVTACLIQLLAKFADVFEASQM